MRICGIRRGADDAFSRNTSNVTDDASHDWNSPLLRRTSACLVLTLIGAELVRRATGVVPTDVTAYLAAADVFEAGGNPYGREIALSPRYEGYRFNYLPGTLYLLQPLAWLSTRAVSIGHLVLSTAALVGSVGYLADRFQLDCSRALLVALALLFGPVAVALYVGNIPLLLLAAVLAVVRASEPDEAGGRRVATCLASGIVLALKPTWAVPAGLALVGRRRWRLAIAFGAGVAGPVALSCLEPELLRAWLDRITSVPGNVMRSREGISLWTFWPLSVVAALLAAGGIALRRPESLWLFACAAVFCSPRLTPYSYVLTLPALAYLVSRWRPWQMALLVLPIWGPLHWWLRVTSHAREQWTMYAWSLVVAGFTGWALLSDNGDAPPQ
jgi:hypothetical protein